MPHKRIAISGKMTSGKTTCSDHLISRYGYKRISFASPIKKIVEEWFRKYTALSAIESIQRLSLEHKLFYYLVEIFDGDYMKANSAITILLEDIFPQYEDIDWSIEKNDKWRKCLQEVGGGRIRTEIENNVWVDYAMRQMEPDGLYICDDLRYANEFQILGDNGFTLIRLYVSPEVQLERLTKLYGTIDPTRLLHPSEVDLDSILFPHTINADQSLVCVLHDLINIMEQEE